jgi:DNA polymerase-3 subunit gamma/tau
MLPVNENMGKAYDLIKYLDSVGIGLDLAGENIRYSAPGTLDPELKESIRQHKSEIILHLRYRHIVRRGDGDYTQAYRPRRISEMTGNENAKTIISSAFREGRLPHTMLFHGASGTGKTTLAKIVAMGLLCSKGPTSEPCCECKCCLDVIKRRANLAILEQNAVELLKADVKQILQEFHWYGFGRIEGTKNSILLIDECHGLSKEQEQVFLKYLEEVSANNYYIFCTTEYGKVLPTLRDRCTLQIEFKEVPQEHIKNLLMGICHREGIGPDAEVLAAIVHESEGRPRRAVNKLQQRYFSGDLKKEPRV